MRQQIDCAVLILSAHQAWLPKVLKSIEPALNRVKIHNLEWEAGHDLELCQEFDQDSRVSLPVETLAQASIGLRRYDVVLLPVSMETIAWTRQALAAIPRGPFTPLLGIFKDMRSAATQDLLEMGVTDFVRVPVCPEEFRARLLNTVTAVPRPGSLREPSLNYGQSIAIARGALPRMNEASLNKWLELTKSKRIAKSIPLEEQIDNVLAGLLPPAPGTDKGASETLELETGSAITSFDSTLSETLPGNHSDSNKRVFRGHLKAIKAKMVEDLERGYIIDALQKNKGNIASAASYSGKHRRAFWALMQKYEIEAEGFRPSMGKHW